MTQHHPAAQDDDNQPIASFVNCHEGILSHLDTFGQLPALLEPAARARTIARETIAFFHNAVFGHHADEEKELFPTVLAKAAPGAEHEQVQRYVTQLVAEHRTIEAHWRELEPHLEKIAKGRDDEDARLVANDIASLVHNYQAHALLEENEFLPLAAQILGRHGEDMRDLGLSLHIRHVMRTVRQGLRGS